MSEEKHIPAHLVPKELCLESGQTMSEYAVVLAALIPASVLLFSGMAEPIASLVTDVAGLLP